MMARDWRDDRIEGLERGVLTGDDPDRLRHQVAEVPKVMATVEEYRLHALGCPKCGISTRATLPPGVPAGNFGPRLQAIVSVCSGAYRMSKRGHICFVSSVGFRTMAPRPTGLVERSMCSPTRCSTRGTACAMGS